MKVYEKTKVTILENLNGKITFDKSLGDNISEQFSQDELEEIFQEVGLNIESIKKVNIAYLCTLSKIN